MRCNRKYHEFLRSATPPLRLIHSVSVEKNTLDRRLHEDIAGILLGRWDLLLHHPGISTSWHW